MISAHFYNRDDKAIWNDFVAHSKNGTFMFQRDYLDYHCDRFTDFSLMFYEDGKLLALMPASRHGEEVRSHGGLTYGGIVSNHKMTVSKMLEVFDALKGIFKENGLRKLLYKCVPSIYHSYPSDEDLYALFTNKATLFRRDISTSIYLPQRIKFAELRRRGVKKALKNNLKVRQSSDYQGYIELVRQILEEHHGVKPVHSGAELQLLAESFPENIKLFIAINEKEKMLAGVVIFDTPQTVHTQYIANSDEGKDLGALDLIMDYLINEYLNGGHKYFDFGISTEDSGRYLNAGLIAQKEGFGGRAVMYDFYEMEL